MQRHRNSEASLSRSASASALLALLVPIALISLLAPTRASALASESAAAPLRASEYSVRALCQQPSLGFAGCLGLKLVAKTPQVVPGARVLSRPAGNQIGKDAIRPLVEFKQPFAHSLTPAELRGAYDLTDAQTRANIQTIAIVDAYDDPTAEADLEHYDQQFDLSACTSANGCFRKIDQAGDESPLPASNDEGNEPEAGWALEISTDIEVARSVCESCHILLVEADSTSLSDLSTAEHAAEQAGATEISDSWGGPECEQDECVEEEPAFSDPGAEVVITVAAGDLGYRGWDAQHARERGSVNYPASSPNVVAVGGTRLIQSDGEWEGETVWNDGGESKGERGGYGAGGGGCSSSFVAPPWQQSLADWNLVGCGTHRAVSDISADADPYSGVAVYDSTPVTEAGKQVTGWNLIGGTSVASPIIASVFALAGGAHGVSHPARTLYENALTAPASLHDVTLGSNGECLQPFDERTGQAGCSSEEQAANSCDEQLICAAHSGYDGPTGLGTPDGIAAFLPASSEGEAGSGEGEGEGESESRSEREAAEREAAGSGEEGLLPGIGLGGEAREAFTGLTLPPGAHPIGPSLPIGGLIGPSGSSPTNAVLPILSAPALTRSASTALRRRSSAGVVLVAFTFTLNVNARVQVRLARRAVMRGRRRWRALPYSLAIAATKGRDSDRLKGARLLFPGRYQLTLTPQRGRSRTIVFTVG